MSLKRQAPTDLNRDNWDEEEPAEDKGNFTVAPKDVIEKRVIRTAKRRNPISGGPSKSVFSGFGGFNKTQPPSYDFLANLTNGSNKNTNGSSTSSGEVVTSSLFANKPANLSGGLFETPASSSPSKSLQSSPLTSTTSPFGAVVKTSSSTLFTATKADSTVNETPFKIQSVSSSADGKIEKSPLAQNANVFGVSSTSASENKPLFSSTNSTSFKIQPVSSTTAVMVQTSLGISTSTTTAPVTTDKKSEDKSNNDKKMKYYAKLKGLNESVSEWINQHVAQTPVCILSPIFADYEKYLAEIIKEYQGGENEGSDKKPVDDKAPEAKPETVPQTMTTPFGLNNLNPSPFSSSPSNTAPKPIFGTDNNLTSSSENKQPTFSFGIQTSTNNTSNTITTNSGFSFGVSTPSMAITTASPFSLTTNASSSQSGSTPFSFGIGKPFSFSSNNVSQQNSEPATNENEEDEPPKVEYTPVKEDNSVYEKKCKIFVKKDGNFADKGVGTLYVKKIEESGKHQLLVRANTNLGTVLLNLVLAEAIPTQRMGKNNVMLVCIPTPDAKPPPTPVLIRVKTGEEADELLETLNKYKA